MKGRQSLVNFCFNYRILGWKVNQVVPIVLIPHEVSVVEFHRRSIFIVEM